MQQLLSTTQTRRFKLASDMKANAEKYDVVVLEASHAETMVEVEYHGALHAFHRGGDS